MIQKTKVTSSDDNRERLPDIDIDDILDLDELREMGENIELLGEVEDLYHKFPPQCAVQKTADKKAATASGSLESTPSKQTGLHNSQVTPRRSPRNHSEKNSDLQFVVIKLHVTDRTDLHHSIEVPRVMIFAHEDSTTGQHVAGLKQCLQDRSDKRFKMKFHLCEYSTVT